MKMIKCSAVLVLSFVLASCASYFTRKDCEATNWFQHGEKVAMSGKRLDADNYIKECQKVEAKFSFAEADQGFKAGMSKYCSDANVTAVGKAGQKFSFEMCDGQSTKKLQALYRKGVDEYCTPSNAYSVGSSGKIYENVCPKESESAWLVEYKKGRKVYLSVLLQEKERDLDSTSMDLSRAESRRSSLSNELSSLNYRRTRRKREVVYDPKSGAYTDRDVVEEDPRVKNEIDSVETKIRGTESEISRLEQKRRELREEVSRIRIEWSGL
jgi:hypothetical protein